MTILSILSICPFLKPLVLDKMDNMDNMDTTKILSNDPAEWTYYQNAFGVVWGCNRRLNN